MAASVIRILRVPHGRRSIGATGVASASDDR